MPSPTLRVVFATIEDDADDMVDKSFQKRIKLMLPYG